MNNLLSNAFKYTPDKGEINVHLYREDDNVCICVADNGQGIIDKDKKHIFERFYQVENVHEGSGIGLSLSKQIMRLSGGTLTLLPYKGKGDRPLFLYWFLIKNKNVLMCQPITIRYTAQPLAN